MTEALVHCRTYQKQAHRVTQGTPVGHGADCEECGGAKVRPATPEEEAAFDARMETVFRQSDRHPRPKPIRGRFVLEID